MEIMIIYRNQEIPLLLCKNKRNAIITFDLDRVDPSSSISDTEVMRESCEAEHWLLTFMEFLSTNNLTLLPLGFSLSKAITSLCDMPSNSSPSTYGIIIMLHSFHAIKSPSVNNILMSYSFRG